MSSTHGKSLVLILSPLAVVSSSVSLRYFRFHHCSVRSFDTHEIHFRRLALSRYYTSDFVELCFRFGKMMNPLLHLQRSLALVLHLASDWGRCIQRSIPSSAFWENYDRTEVFNRKLTLEFFLMRKTHIFLQVAFESQITTTIAPSYSNTHISLLFRARTQR